MKSWHKRERSGKHRSGSAEAERRGRPTGKAVDGPLTVTLRLAVTAYKRPVSGNRLRTVDGSRHNTVIKPANYRNETGTLVFHPAMQ